MSTIYVSDHPFDGEVYLTSNPTNLYQRLRMGLAHFFIRRGLALTLRNGWSKTETGTS